MQQFAVFLRALAVACSISIENLPALPEYSSILAAQKVAIRVLITPELIDS
jgi:hypothetical protein